MKVPNIAKSKEIMPQASNKQRATPVTAVAGGDVESVPLCGYRLYVPCVQHRRHKGGFSAWHVYRFIFGEK